MVSCLRIRKELGVILLFMQMFIHAQKVVMRLKKPRCTAYIWSSGKIVCTGTTSEDDAKKASRKIARRLQVIGFKVGFLFA